MRHITGYLRLEKSLRATVRSRSSVAAPLAHGNSASYGTLLVPGCCSGEMLPFGKVGFPKGKGSQNALMSKIAKAQVAAKHISPLMPVAIKSGSGKLPAKYPIRCHNSHRVRKESRGEKTFWCD